MEPLTFDLVKRALLKRMWAIAGFTVVCGMIAAFVAYILPPTYTAGAKILVESQQIPTELAQSTVTASANERLELIQQRLMTRENLVEVIERINLFEDRDDMTVSDMVETVRKNTRFQKIAISSQGRRERQVAAFILSYSSEDGREAARMANELTTIVLEQNLASRSERASQTLEFFNNEANRLQTELSRAQAELARFKQENALSLPQGLEFRQKELSDLRDRRFDLESKILDQQKRLRDIKQRLEAGQYGPEFAGTASPQQVMLAQLNQDLTAASAVYAPSHPTIRRLRSQISQVEASISASDTPASRIDLETLRRQARDDLIEEGRLISTSIKLAEEELGGLASRRDELEVAIARSPQVGLDLDTLQRRVSTLENQYQVAVAKRAAAETGQKLEINQQAERFEVIEPAKAPDEPESPNRQKIAMMGTAGALGFALGLAVLVEMLNRAIYTAADLERRLEIRPLITIPYIRTAEDVRRRRRRIFILGFLALAAPIVALILLDQFYLPLDLLFEKVLERTNLDVAIQKVMERF